MTPRRQLERLFRGLCLAALALALGLSLALLVGVVVIGLGRIDLEFLAGPLLAGTLGSAALVGSSTLIAVPVGIATAIWLEEYAPRDRGLLGLLGRIVEVNVTNLAGVPSVIYGLLGLALFVGTLGLGAGWLSATLTLAALTLPIVVLASREPLRAVPAKTREAGLALGSTRWQVIRQLVLPMALPGILSGTIHAVARTLGEAAPLLVLGLLSFDVLPIQIFEWTTRADGGVNAAGGIVGMLIAVVGLHGWAMRVRDRGIRG